MNGKPLYTLMIDVPPAQADAVASRLFDAGLRGLEESEHDGRIRLLTYGDDEKQIEYYAQTAREYLRELALLDPAAPPGAVAIKTDPHSDWSTSWMKYFSQTPLTDTLIVQPSWDATAAPAGKKKIIIEPKMAFGFGTHATTQMAARSVERFCSNRPGCRVLDVGTGTGVLALVAALNGAGAALGLDHDLAALDAARENAALNNLQKVCRFSSETLDRITEDFGLVVANITTPTLKELAEQLVTRVTLGGLLSMTGVLSESANEVALTFIEQGFELIHREDQDEWCLLEMVHG